jgi:hypothetical protein
MRLGFFLAKPLDFLHLCMGEDIHKININLILLTLVIKHLSEPLCAMKFTKIYQISQLNKF